MVKTEVMLIGSTRDVLKFVVQSSKRLTGWIGILLGLALLALLGGPNPVAEASSANAVNQALHTAHGPHVVSAAATPMPEMAMFANAHFAPVAQPTLSPLILGAVTYRTTNTKIAGVTVSVAGPSSMQSTTDASGNYTVTISVDGLHTVTPALTGQVNGISSFDAAYIAQCTTGLRAMSDCPLLAADTSGNNALSSFDAALVAQYAAGLAAPNSRVGRWVFSPASRSYDTYTVNQFNQNYAGYLIGEVSGNWQPAVVAVAQSSDGQ